MRQFLSRQRRAAVQAEKKPAGKETQPLEETMPLDEVAPGIGLEGFISATWTRLGDRKYQAMTYGNVSAPQLSWGEDLVCGNPKEGGAICAFDRGCVGPSAGKQDPKALRWQQNLPEGWQATSVVACKNAIAIGGGIYQPRTAGRGFVRVLSADKGQTLAEQRFESPLGYNSVAVADGRVYATLADGSAACLGEK
jgi:outer membrane protein assembly factor BamB